MTSPPKKPNRCAIYTRKSSEEGLEQSFNSLHAQREACEAYIKAQAHEGWRLVPTAFDDGGLSGGTMDRPALQKLLAAIESGLIDTIVVYKIDRLTRSLADFARIVERLDAASASFVSVTQSFNTTSSMGRLTLNVLLSFAQFEREVTGERIRDKIQASKKRGMWMGGVPPLGYDPPTDPVARSLVPNEQEAQIVRRIFKLYLACKSVPALLTSLKQEGILSKRWTTKNGKAVGGVRFSRGALYHLLHNRIYRGELKHRDGFYADAHPAILDENLFSRVQTLLDKQAVERKTRAMQVAAMPLTGKLFDSDGHPMSPTFAYGRAGRVYRYYVSAPLQQGFKLPARSTAIRRVAAVSFEEVLQHHLAAWFEQDHITPLETLLQPITRIELERTCVHITLDKRLLPRRLLSGLDNHHNNPDLGIMTLSIRYHVARGRSWVESSSTTNSYTRPDPVLIRGLKQAHAFAAAIGAPHAITAPNAVPQPPASTYERRLSRLAFLAPDLQKMILEGRQPQNLTLKGILSSELPLNWEQQRQALLRALPA